MALTETRTDLGDRWLVRTELHDDETGELKGWGEAYEPKPGTPEAIAAEILAANTTMRDLLDGAIAAIQAGESTAPIEDQVAALARGYALYRAFQDGTADQVLL